MVPGRAQPRWLWGSGFILVSFKDYYQEITNFIFGIHVRFREIKLLLYLSITKNRNSIFKNGGNNWTVNFVFARNGAASVIKDQLFAEVSAESRCLVFDGLTSAERFPSWNSSHVYKWTLKNERLNSCLKMSILNI